MKTNFTLSLFFLLYFSVQAQINSGMIAYYPFSNNFNDVSGNAFHAVQQHGNVGFAGDRALNNSSAAYFNGSSQYVRLGDILDSVFCKSIAQFSISGWAKSDSWAPWQGGGNIISKSAGGSGNAYQWSIQHDVDGTVRAYVSSDASASNFLELKSAVLSTGQWFHFVMVFDGSLSGNQKLKFFVNGQAAGFSRSAGTLSSSTVNTNQQVVLGGCHLYNNLNTPGNLYNGYVDEIRIYNRALNSTEISTLSNSSYLPVSVLQPNGGEKWISGSSQTITWTAPEQVQFVKIEYSLNGGTGWNSMSASVLAATGSYTWNVPIASSTQALIRISDASNISVSDQSDQNFSIQIATGLAHPAQATQIQLYPNPSHTGIYYLGKKTEQAHHYAVYNTAGKLLRQGVIQAGDRGQVNISDCTPGLYLLYIEGLGNARLLLE